MGVSFEKILWVLDALDVEWERKLGVRTVAKVMVKHPHWISGETPIRQAIEDLETRGFSQAPVRDLNRGYIGVLVREHAASLLSRGKSPTHPTRDFVEDAIKVHLQTGVRKLVQILGEGTPFVLVEWKGEVVGIVSYTDLCAKVGELRVRRTSG